MEVLLTKFYSGYLRALLTLSEGVWSIVLVVKQKTLVVLVMVAKKKNCIKTLC